MAGAIQLTEVDFAKIKEVKVNTKDLRKQTENKP